MERNYEIISIKDGLSECLSLVQSPALSDLAAAIGQSMKKLEEPMQLAIIGKISSSKSTLVNAILGKDELMSTGQKEVTYNVGWLKYGNSESDIVIHYKDGSAPMRKSRADFARYSVDSTHEEIDRISYIETFDDAEILKEINIIDTPGLDAKREKDSQNTLDFISKVRPDAVLMLFTHAVSESTLDVVKSFNAAGSFNPLNAIGILSKIDVLWLEKIPRTTSALSIGRDMVNKRKRREPLLAKTLFDLYPISALLYLAATTVTQQDVDDIANACESDATAFMKSLSTMPRFLNECSALPENRRRELADKLGLYGIWLLAMRCKNGEDMHVDTIKSFLLKESGAADFRKTLYNHFGSRAKLIKLESIYQHINQKLIRAKATVKNLSDRSVLTTVEQKISDIFNSFVHEHCEYDLLTRLYAGELDLDDDVAVELRNVCGENGNSAPEKLGMPAGTDMHQLLQLSQQKEKQWRREVALEPDPEVRQLMNVILKSYTLLRQKITTSIYQYEQSKSFLLNQ